MERIELVIDHERFRVSERWQPDGRMSYDFSWLNGPADGTYGFTIGRLTTEPGTVARMTREQLVEAAREFVESFYAPGGIGEEDFPDHISERDRPAGS